MKAIHGSSTFATRFVASLAVSVCALALLAATGTSCAAGDPAAHVPGAEVRLIAAGGTGSTREAGLELRFQPNFKTYWRYPGDSGVPPSFSFAGSRNVAAVDLAWPAPRRFADGAGGFSIGYKSAAMFPLRVTLKDPDAPARLEVAFDFAVCEALCIPASVRLALDLDTAANAANAQRIAAARARVPEPQPLGADATPAVLAARLDADSTPPQLVVDARIGTPMADLFVEGPDAGWTLPLPQKIALPGGIARFTLPMEGIPAGVDFSAALLTFTLSDTPRSVVTVAAPQAR